MSDIFYLQPVWKPVTPGQVNCDPAAHDHCLICRDDARPAAIVQLKLAEGLAIVELDGQPVEIDITLLEDVVVGQVVLIHGGVALEQVG